jgi:signal transduction histidine kinase
VKSSGQLELADTFDDMLERLDGAFDAQRRFVANASHELRTPLTVMRTAIDVTLAKPSPTARQLSDMAVRVRRSIDRSESMVEALLTLAVSDQGKLSTEFTDLATWAEDAIDAAAPEIERMDLRVDAKLDPAEATGDLQLLERMVWNLVDNAVRHNEPGGWIRLRTGSGDAVAYLQIANSGRSSRTTPCPRCSSQSGAWKPGPASAPASGSACPSPGRSSPRTTRQSPSAARPTAASTSP